MKHPNPMFDPLGVAIVLTFTLYVLGAALLLSPR